MRSLVAQCNTTSHTDTTFSLATTLLVPAPYFINSSHSACTVSQQHPRASPSLQPPSHEVHSGECAYPFCTPGSGLIYPFP